MKRKIWVLLAPGLLAATGCLAQTNQWDTGPWPNGASPREIGLRVAEHFVPTPHGNGVKPRQDKIIYPEVCTWYGALTFAQLSGNKELTAKLINRFEPLFGAEARLIAPANHVDNTIFGAIPLEIYMQTRQQRYLDMGKPFPDQQWQAPQGTRLSPEVSGWVAQGLSWQSRFWTDDMYMLTLVEVQAFRATGQTQYLDRAALEMSAYLDKLQQTNGLFYHALDVHYFWGRGDGWIAAGMSELLRSLPENHPKRARILEGYRAMMAALLQYQDADGMWHQLIDHPESFKETSCTGMFTFAMITGVKNGWLDPKAYGPAARKGWLALVGYINDNADIREVCEGTDKKNDLNWYLTRGRNVGDFHGQAPVLWCASAWLRPSP
ncbi:MAG: glycoside hydrolase family 88 protein [Verrucomicrobiota bacterium]